ncbi:hypothetical protein C0995_007708 [Termitomyces sp. Mi166|nr:hypothetical protein C0995_007708 [Termitomyces sp. Mi166\
MSYELTGIMASDIRECSGGFADIYKGDFRGRTVCLKTVRLHREPEMAKFVKGISKEAILWGQLHHPNLLPFYGIYWFKNRISLVAPWMENGVISEYLEQHTVSNRVVLAYDVSNGLGFLHKNKIIHGDLKGTNILVNSHGRACVADFGLSSISDKEILALTSYSSAASKGGTVRWQAPELFGDNKEKRHNTKASDIYACACVAYEARQIPFAHLSRDASIISRVSRGARPSRPIDTTPSWGVWGLTQAIWALMEACWNQQPEERPSVEVVIQALGSEIPTNLQVNAPVDDETLSAAEFRKMMHMRAKDFYLGDLQYWDN